MTEMRTTISPAPKTFHFSTNQLLTINSYYQELELKLTTCFLKRGHVSQEQTGGLWMSAENSASW